MNIRYNRSQNALNAIPKKNGFAMPMPSLIIRPYVLEKTFSHMNKYIFDLYVHIYEELFSKTLISEHGIVIATSIFEFVLNAFWNRALHIYESK